MNPSDTSDTTKPVAQETKLSRTQKTKTAERTGPGSNSKAKKSRDSNVAAVRRGTKTDKILRLLRRPEGASLGELTRATKWQPHSVRGFLSGAVKRKMHLKVSSLKRANGERAYRLSSK